MNNKNNNNNNNKNDNNKQKIIKDEDWIIIDGNIH